ncbi:Gfo/Idh/MocA family protein [Streptomyces noursei]|uniref:Gfo/Idh/MocA family protein n=1 Tax=Streptomyces noursei TaxID=1971 RepID=UPI00167C3C30|nr:Gfo/Idh/MocA family oxidoreductase [Streptomyces noursei]MCZ1019561.1 Gfo/Idh/MocA family oxidoreductase [Streptomyces noursei]
MTRPSSCPPLGFGVLGCADIAWRRTAPALAADPGVRLTAFASRSPEKGRRFAERFGDAAVTDYDALLRRPDVDAVYVPLPAMLQAEWIERALTAGKHVFAEKPLSPRAADTARLFALAEERGVVLKENAMFLHHSQHTAVDRLLADGAIGQLRGFSAAFTIPPLPESNIRNHADLGAGALLDVAVYPVRAALRFLGPRLEVVGATLREADGVVRSGSALLVTPEGVPAQLTFGMEHAYRTEYALTGSTGRLRLDRAFTPPPGHQPVVDVTRQDHREQITLPPDDQFARIVAAFVREVRGEAPAERAASAAESRRVAETIDALAARAVRTKAPGDVS